jgi:hypothetical protein
MLALVGALGWIVGLLACAVWVGRSFARENFKYLWPISVSALRLFFVRPSIEPCVSLRRRGVGEGRTGK